MTFFLKKHRLVTLSLFLIIALNAVFVTPAFAKPVWQKLLEQTAKAAGGAAIVRGLAGELNKFINTLMLNNHAENKEMTKVVPILTLSSDMGTIGAAQVCGPDYKIEEVRSVILLESVFQGKYRIKAYIPCNSSNPLNVQRVYGVGITAVMDIKI